MSDEQLEQDELTGTAEPVERTQDSARNESKPDYPRAER